MTYEFNKIKSEPPPPPHDDFRLRSTVIKKQKCQKKVYLYRRTRANPIQELCARSVRSHGSHPAT